MLGLALVLYCSAGILIADFFVDTFGEAATFNLALAAILWWSGWGLIKKAVREEVQHAFWDAFKAGGTDD